MTVGPTRARTPHRRAAAGPWTYRALAAGHRHRTRVEGAAAPVGPFLPSDVLVSRELPGGPDPRLHRPLFAAGGRRPRPVLGPRHDPAASLRRGADRGRQRPQPVRPPADGVEGRARDPRRRDDPAHPAAWGGTPTRPPGARSPDAWPTTSETGVPKAGSRGAGPSGAESVPVEVALAFHPDTLGQLLFVRLGPAPRRSDRPVPRRRDHRDPPRQERELPVGADAEHLQHGAALRPRFRGADGVRVAAPRRVRRAGVQGRPLIPAARPVDRRHRPPRRRAGRRAPRTGPRCAPAADLTEPGLSSRRRPTSVS